MLLKHISICLIPAVLSLQSPALAEDWTSVTSLAPGTGIRLTTLGEKKKVSGFLGTADQNSITLATHGTKETFQRPDIEKVYDVGHRTRNRVLGFAFLGLTGVSGAVTAVAYANRPPGSTVVINPIGLAFAGATAGLGTWFLLKSRGKKIYSKDEGH
jgi:hypothetical protein